MMVEKHAELSMEFFFIPVQTTITPAIIPAYAPLANNKNQPQISIKLAKPKPFNGNPMQAHMWLSAVKHYFIVVGLTYTATEAADTEAVCQYAVALMSSNAVR